MSIDQALNWDSWLSLCSASCRRVQVSMTRTKQLDVPQWHLILIPDNATAYYKMYPSFEEMLDAVRAIEDRSVYTILPFYGMRCRLNRAIGSEDLFYLQHPDGELHPLFDIHPGVVEVEDSRFAPEEALLENRPLGGQRFDPDEVGEEEHQVFMEVPPEDEPDADPEDPADGAEDAILPSDGIDESNPFP